MAITFDFEKNYGSNFIKGYNMNGELISDSSNRINFNHMPIKIFQAKKSLYFSSQEELDSFFNIQDLIHDTKSFTFELLISNYTAPFHTLPQADIRQDIAGLEWTHLLISYDGFEERKFFNGKFVEEEHKISFMSAIDSIGLTRVLGITHFPAYISNLKFVNYAFDNEAIENAVGTAHNSDYLYALESADYDLGAIKKVVGYDGFSKPITSVCKRCEVSVQKQRMSFELSSLVSDDLASILSTSHLSLSIEYLNKDKWSQVFIDKVGDKKTVYIDGLVTDKVLDDFLVVSGNEIKFRFRDIHNLRIYKPNTVHVNEIYQEFRDRISLDLVNNEVSVLTHPHKINDSNLFVALAGNNSYLNYKFFIGYSSSKWSSEPHYLFDNYNGQVSIDVQLRDIYGNVSKKYSIPIQYPKLSLRADIVDREWMIDDSIAKSSVWENVIDKNVLTGKSIILSKGFQGWMLGSKTNSSLYTMDKEAFLYNFIDHDFTIELKIEDISGKLSNNLEDNEVGIIVQPVDYGPEYITNSVNTINKMGNVAAHCDANGIVMHSNNSGLQFNKYLQIQKSGHHYYLRTSRDGNKWQNLISNPINQKHWAKRKLKLGIYQFSNSQGYKYGLISNVKIWSINP